eukprot:scaffold593_cov126-Cylindrotheca_fusiformis.AAC.10
MVPVSELKSLDSAAILPEGRQRWMCFPGGTSWVLAFGDGRRGKEGSDVTIAGQGLCCFS